MSVTFIKPMESLAVKKLPIGGKWTYEVKLDGFRAVAVRTDHVVLYSKQGKLLTSQFMQIALELEKLPSETLLDGELVEWRASIQPATELSQRLGPPDVLRIRHPGPQGQGCHQAAAG